MDIYKFAVQNKLRFHSNRGMLTVEQLFDLPLKSQNGFDLDTTARIVNGQLKEVSQESFVEEAAADPRKSQLEVALGVVKDVIKVKQAENAAQRDRVRKAAERKKILDAMAAKQDAAYTTASMEELEKKLAELD